MKHAPLFVLQLFAVKVLRKDFLVNRGERTIQHAIAEKQILQNVSLLLFIN